MQCQKWQLAQSQCMAVALPDLEPRSPGRQLAALVTQTLKIPTSTWCELAISLLLLALPGCAPLRRDWTSGVQGPGTASCPFRISGMVTDCRLVKARAMASASAARRPYELAQASERDARSSRRHLFLPACQTSPLCALYDFASRALFSVYNTPHITVRPRSPFEVA